MREDWKRQFAVFLGGQSLSIFGSSLVQYAIVWYITLTTQSGVMMTLSILCGFVPYFLLSPFAGVWADRHDRKKIIILSDAFVAFVTLVAALVFMGGVRDIWVLLLAQALRAVGSALQAPAVGAILPQIVPADQLTRANGINTTLQSALLLISPAVSGLLLSVAPIEVLFFIDVVTAALAIGTFVVFLRVPLHEKALQPGTVGYFADMKLGFRYIREHRYLVPYFWYFGAFIFLITPAALLTPLQVARSFGPEVWRLTAIEIAFSGGMLIGGTLIAVWGGLKNRMQTMLVSHLVMALAAVVLGLLENFGVYSAVMACIGIAMPCFNTAATVILQEHVEEGYLGRVYSILAMISTSLMPLAMLLFGPVSERVRIETILILSGVALLVMVPLVWGSRRLMEAGAPGKAQDTGREIVK